MRVSRPRLWSPFVLGRQRVLAMRILLLDGPVLTMDHELRTFGSTNLSPVVDRGGLLIEVLGSPLGARLLDVPAAGRSGNNVDVLLCHDIYPRSIHVLGPV